MKKILFAAAALAAFSACVAEVSETPETAQGPVNTVVSAYLSGIGKTAVEGVKLSWREGDDIAINGSASYPLPGDTDVAFFGFADALSFPYRAVYPAGLWKSSSAVTLPSVWDADLTQIPLHSYITGGETLLFSPLTAVMRLRVTGNGETLRRVVLSAKGGEDLSGDFAIDWQSGSLSASAGTSSAVALNCNAVLSPTPLDLYIPVPGGTYSSGFSVDLFDAEDNSMRLETGARVLEAGQLRAMPEIAFYPRGIRDADDFIAFAEAVNSGSPTEAWENAEGVVTLLDDIDFSAVSDWTPVGEAVTCWKDNTLSVVSGHPFTGKFDGRGHKISDFSFYYAASGSGVSAENMYSVACGIFGCLTEGAVVGNLVIDGSCSFEFHPSVRSDAGVVAGVVFDASVLNVTNYAPFSVTPSSADNMRQTLGLVGFAFARDGETRLEYLVNEGEVSGSNGNNAKNGATGVQVAGILGFGSNDLSSAERVHVFHCTNNGDIDSKACRASGIVAAANRYTVIEYCENHGNNYNAFPVSGSGRIGNITCISGAGSEVINSTNYGDVVCSTKARAGGIVSLVNHASCNFVRCANYGRVITDETTYRGTIFQQCNLAAGFTACIGSGDVGAYNNGNYAMVGVNGSNYFNYVGYHSSAAVNVTSSNIIYGSKPVWKGIENMEDLLAFAHIVNTGGDASAFLVGNDVQILCDIDASSIREWVPIGNSAHPLEYNIKGMGHRISHVNWTIDTGKYTHAGLFGDTGAITISDLVFGDENSSVVFSGNPSKLRAGGIVGYALGTTLSNVVNNAALETKGNTAYGNDLIIGGLAGYVDGNSTLGGTSVNEGCTNNGNVLVPVVCQQGGLVGYNSGVIRNCTNTGAILGKTDGSQYGPAWGCSYNRVKGNFSSNIGGGYVDEYSKFSSDPSAAAPSTFYNAVRDDYKNKFDPEDNRTDWTLDAYYDWTEVERLNLATGAVYHHYSFKNVPRHMHALEIDLSSPAIELATALADDLMPNPNGRDNDHLYEGFVLRETLSMVCNRRRNAGQGILAGTNLGFFDSEAGILRGFHVEDGEPLYINNPSVVASLGNHRWGFTVFNDGTASCGKKAFTGTLRWNGAEYPYYTINDTTMRHASPAVAPINLYTSRYVKIPHSSNTSLQNPMAPNVLYVICEYTLSRMKVNCGYAQARVTRIADGRTTPLSTLPYLSAKNQIGIALSGAAASSWSSVKVGDTVEFKCDISVDGDASRPITMMGSTMYQLMTDGRDASNTPGPSASLHSKYDPMTFPVVSRDGTKVWIVEIDGRQIDSNKWYSLGVRGYEMYKIGAKLGGWSVTRMDGGGSSAMWVWRSSQGKGSIVSSPCDWKGERSCMSYLLLRSKN
ncbi:MAG: phosphodiester glycosidase family protein [Bacteroidales bacterium]|nr:phosphodiester glycosidase family protein [Bacteroidales bacterium]